MHVVVALVPVVMLAGCTDEICSRGAHHETRDTSATVERGATTLALVHAGAEVVTARALDGVQASELRMSLGVTGAPWTSISMSIELGGSPDLGSRRLRDLGGVVRVPAGNGSVRDLGVPGGTVLIDHYDVECDHYDPDDDAAGWVCATDVDATVDATINDGGETYHLVTTLTQRDLLRVTCSKCTGFEGCDY